MSVMARRYWLMKSEPGVFSIADLERAKGQTTGWEGVRNYQARNFLRAAQVGDGVLFWHSGTAQPGAAGTAVVARAAYPDPTQFDPRSEYHDPAATEAEPRWVALDLRFESAFPRVVTLDELRGAEGLAEMIVLRRGNRLSVTPVSPGEWRIVLRLARRAPR
jgi:predicted RNA-binding protein with PUA-like domain